MNVAIIGASEDPERYSNKAQRMLVEHGHGVIPISPGGKDILGAKGYRSILDIPIHDRPVHTATIYVNPGILESLTPEILESPPSRVILNPGTESADAAVRFREAGIEVVEACTLVLLSTGQFEPPKPNGL